MYHNPFDITDPSKEVYRVNLAELSDLIRQDQITRCGDDQLPFNGTAHFMAIADGHDLTTMNVPISTIALLYGIDTGFLALKKARYVDGTPVKFSPKVCQKFIIDQLSLWYYQIFTGATPDRPTELMKLTHTSESEHELYFAMIRATNHAHEKKLPTADFYQHTIDCLLEQFKLSRNAIAATLNEEYPTDMDDRIVHITRQADWYTSHLAYWYHALEQLNSPDADLPNFKEIMRVGMEVFNYPIESLLEDGATYADPEVRTLTRTQEIMNRQFIDQLQGIFFWTYRPASLTFPDKEEATVQESSAD